MMFEVFRIISHEYAYLAAVFHFLLLVLIAGWLFNGHRMNQLTSAYLAWLSLAVMIISINIGKTLNFPLLSVATTTLFAGLIIFWLVELSKPRNIYTLREKDGKTIFFLVSLGFLGFWYPVFTENPFLGLVVSPLGLLPGPTLIITLATLCAAQPRVNTSLHIYTTLLGWLHSIVGIKLGIRLDAALLLLSIYSTLLILQKLRGSTKHP